MGNLLVPIKKFLSNKNTITILGVLVGIIVLYFGYTWRVNKSIQPISVPIANKTLFSGDRITENDISSASFPKQMIGNMSNLITDSQFIVNKLVSYEGKIPLNSFFFDSAVMSEDEMPDSIFSNLQDGHTIYRLPVDYTSTYANSIMPENKIDLYMTTQDDEGEGLLVFGRLMSSIQVLAVKDGAGKDVFRDKDNPGEPKYLLFSVPEDLFLLLMKAEKLGITIEPVPRNKSYASSAAAVEIESNILKDMILVKTYKISDECEDITFC